MKFLKFAWAALGVLLALIFVRFLLAIQGGLTADDAYWWLLAERLEWASFEGPGGLAGLLAALREAGFQSLEAQRMIGPFFLLLGTVGIGLWAAGRGGFAAGVWAAVAWNLLPAVNSQSFVFGPVLPLSAAWIWFWVFSERGAMGSRNASLWWTAAGVAAAIGMLFSYWMLAGLAALLLWGLVEHVPGGKIADWFLRKPAAERSTLPAFGSLRGPFWLALLIPLVSLVGPYFWNASNGWLALSGQTMQSLLEFRFSQGLAFATTGSILAAFFGGLALVGIGIWVFREFSRSSSARQIFAVGFFPVLLCFGAVWNGTDPVIPWLLAAPALIVGACWWLAGAERSPGRIARVWRSGMVWVLLGLSSISALQIANTQSPAEEPDWSALVERVRRARQVYQPAGTYILFLVAESRDLAAAMGYYFLRDNRIAGGDFPPVFLRESQNTGDQFGLWPRYDEFLEAGQDPESPYFTEQEGRNPYIGRSAIYITRERPADLPQTISNGFNGVIPLEEIRMNSSPSIFLYFCEDYQSAPL